jgi:hypothetical protein
MNEMRATGGHPTNITKIFLRRMAEVLGILKKQ